MTIKRSMYLVVAVLLIAAGIGGCGDSTVQNEAADSGCPPIAKSGLSAIDRVGGIEALEKYTQWQEALPPSACAGKLAKYVPELPSGYGLPPLGKPPIFNDQQVYLTYAKIPENVPDDALALLSIAGQPQFVFEIVQLSDQETQRFNDLLASNGSSIVKYPLEGRNFYSLPGSGWSIPGNKLFGGIGTLVGDNILIKFSVPGMYADKSVIEPVARMFHEIANKNGF